MNEAKYILLIMNCQKYRSKALYQKQTWLPTLKEEIVYFHVIGNINLPNEFLFDYENNILWVKQPDDYVSLPKKVIAAYEAIDKTYFFEYIFKTDDDQILVKQSFFSILTSLISIKKPKSHYGGYMVDVKKPYLSQYHKIHNELPEFIRILITKYCTGRFYFLSKEAFKNLLTEKKELIRNECLEDYAIGFHLHNKWKTNLMEIKTNDFFTDIEYSDYPNWLKERSF